LRVIIAFGKFQGVIEAAINPLCLFAKKLDERRAIGHLALGLGQRLALLGGQDLAQIILIGHHQIEPFAHHLRALFAGPLGPFLLRRFRLRNRTGHLCTAQVCHFRDHIAARRVQHVKRAILPLHPFAANIGAGFQQAGIFEH
jgi:hypothetical protein